MPSANTKRRDDIVDTLKRLCSLIDDRDDWPTLRAVVRKVDDDVTIPTDTLGGEAVSAVVNVLRSELE